MSVFLFVFSIWGWRFQIPSRTRIFFRVLLHLISWYGFWKCKSSFREHSVPFSGRKVARLIGGFRGGAEGAAVPPFSKRFCTTPTVITVLTVLKTVLLTLTLPHFPPRIRPQCCIIYILHLLKSEVVIRSGRGGGGGGRGGKRGGGMTRPLFLNFSGSAPATSMSFQLLNKHSTSGQFRFFCLLNLDWWIQNFRCACLMHARQIQTWNRGIARSPGVWVVWIPDASHVPWHSRRCVGYFYSWREMRLCQLSLVLSLHSTAWWKSDLLLWTLSWLDYYTFYCL